MDGTHRPGLHRPGYGCGNIQCADCYPLGGRKGAKNSEARKRERTTMAIEIRIEIDESRAQGDEADLVRQHAVDSFHDPSVWGLDAVEVTVGALRRL